MQRIDGQPVYSATDLVGYLACDQLIELERAALAGLVRRPLRRDPVLDILSKRGLEHERRYLEEQSAQGKRVVAIEPDGSIADRGEQLRDAAEATRAAVAAAADVIYQATFFDGRWRGQADFLIRVEDAERPSVFGPYHYEVADTKLARHVKASALLQICSYVDQLERVQGVSPARMHVVLGGNPGRTETFRVEDFLAYYRMVRSRFEAAVGPAAGAPTYPLPAAPDPVEHCDVCRWAEGCDARRRQDDHLSLVAGITRSQRRELADRGANTLAALAALPLPLDSPPQRTSRSALERVREQARIQLQGRESGRLLHELLLPVEENKGLAGLPPPSPGDLFLDLEGDPYAFDNGLDYLFGVLEPSKTDQDGELRFHYFWSSDDDGTFSLGAEKAAFEATIDLIMDRLAADPAMHVYHYAPYEPSAFKRLMGLYGTREEQVDALLRGSVFVDLYRVVRQGLRASVESYSIKRIEPLYNMERQVPLRDATSSIVEFETWLELGEGERPTAENLERILAYNRDDVVSTWRLRDWLEEQRAALAASGVAVPRPSPAGGAPSEQLADNLQRAAALAERLTEGVPVDPEERDAERQGRWLLAQLLSWHRREEKSTWWLFYHLMNDLTDDERIEARDPIGGLKLLERVGETPKSWIYRYRFPSQEHSIGAGSEVHDPGTGETAGAAVAIDEASGTIDVRRSKANDAAPHPSSIVPLDRVNPRVLQESLLRLGDWVAEHGVNAAGSYRAARDLLLRARPRLDPGSGLALGDPLTTPNESVVEAARGLVVALDHSVLPIQGPPGSGKTFTGARMIVSLLAAGRKVGITANSHKVIGNLLSEACRVAEREGVSVRAVQKADVDQFCDHPSVTLAKTNKTVDDAVAGEEVNLVAGTAWLWARPEMEGSVDVLFIDEAGQLSLANALAVAQAAGSLVLLGDPQQLDQPLQGVHPPGADASSLGHLLDGQATMPPERGLFLATTWRLHPEVCRFTSEAFYEGKLVSEEHLDRQQVDAGSLAGTGLRLYEIAHAGNDNLSEEEAALVARLARELVEGSATWTDAEGREQKVGWQDVLVVAPYNAQVGAIQRLLPPQARVGTVDKFQGQQAPISIYSMATSSPEEAPRGMTFLYSRNRLNVATSRAKCVAVLVCSPDLLRVQARSPEQMRLANALCQFVEHARRG